MLLLAHLLSLNPGWRGTKVMVNSIVKDEEERQTLVREEIILATPWGEIKAKKVVTPSGPVIYPEYEECSKIASLHHIPLQEVYDEVRCRQRRSE